MTQAEAKIKLPWDQSGFEKLKATWSPERIAEDEKALEEIFKLAADSPTLKQALDWAETHGIKFFVDRQSVNCGGYYTSGTGVFAIAERYAYPSDFAVEVITHELRHAWQDYHGLIGSIGYFKNRPLPDFAEDFTQLALIEADAFTVGKSASDEYRYALDKRFRDAHPCFNAEYPLQPFKAEPLEKGFLYWFSSFRKTNYYGDAASKALGKAVGVYDGPLPPRNFEFSPEAAPIGTGVDITHPDSVLQLGRGFSGNSNYLSKKFRDALVKKILQPSLARSFYNAANDNQKQLTTQIRKQHLRKKLSAHFRK